MAVLGRHELSSEVDLEELVGEIVQEVRGGDILLLIGELGAGKTTFTKYLAKALKVKDEITSPTFTIMGEYEVQGHASIRSLVHVDLYRLEELQGEDLQNIRDVLTGAADNRQLVVIEWADKLGNEMPGEAWKFDFEHGTNEGMRAITIRHGKEG